MNTHTEKTEQANTKPVSQSLAKQHSSKSTVKVIDNRPKMILQRKMLEAMNASEHAVQLKHAELNAVVEMKSKVNVNDDSKLEKETDVMGEKALQKKQENTAALSFTNNKNTSIAPIQRFKNAQEMAGVQGFRYQDIIAWNGTPGLHNGVAFISDPTIDNMAAYPQTMQIRYNPVTVGPMTPRARYFIIMHELSHLYYQHPGNQHPESAENEVQADDTALVNAVTLYPEETIGVMQDVRALLKSMSRSGQHGGGSHPLTVNRKNRLRRLLVEIEDHATIQVQLTSNWVPQAQMNHFIFNNGHALLLDANDIHTFQAGNGPFSYIQGNGTVTLRRFLQWLPQFRARHPLIPNFRYTWNWVVRPVTIQNNVKDQLP